MKLSQNAKNAVLIGTLCSVSYLAVYVARNVLGAVTPKMLEGGVFDEEYIGLCSSVYFVLYAVGQLVNGWLGDRIKARYMIASGLLLAGVTNFVFARLGSASTSALVVYGATGFFLSMIYAPMTKIVAENTDPVHATRCSLGYTFASFFGSPMAGLLATFLAWQRVFEVSSVVLAVMAVASFFAFLVLEKKGIVRYGGYQRQKGVRGNVELLFRERIVRFTAVSVLTGVVRTSVVFWIPTYIVQRFLYAPETATAINTVATLIISFTAFLSVFVYERLHRDMDKTMFFSFLLSTLAFIGVYFVTCPVVNVVFLVVAVMGGNSAATMLWSRYCPSLRDTGMVSGATGFLDFCSYIASALASSFFAVLAPRVGWQAVSAVWVVLMLIGTLLFLPIKRKNV